MTSKSIAVIFLADPVRARTWPGIISSESLDALAVDTSDDLYKYLNSQRVDAIIIENELGAFFSGLDILDRIHNDLLRPATIVLAESGAVDGERAKRLGIGAVLPKNVDPLRVRETLETLLSTHSASAIFIHPGARRIVQQSGEIKPLPQLIVKLASYLVDEANIPLARLADDIAVDPRVTADLLTVINSSALGMQRQITRVFDAVNFLGIRRTVSLILSSTILRTQESLGKEILASDRLWYNRRSVFIASAAYAFAKRLGNISPDTSYVLGLFQELGILLLAHSYGDRYLQVLRRAREAGPVRLEALEKQELDLTHADASAAMLQKWGLPLTILRPVLEHHHPNDGPPELPDVERRFIHAMRTAEAAANLADCSSSQRFQSFQRLVEHYGRDRAGDCKLALRDAVAKSTESSKLFNIPIPSEAELNHLVAQIQEHVESS